MRGDLGNAELFSYGAPLLAEVVRVAHLRTFRVGRGVGRQNRTLEAKTRVLAGWKGYTTNLVSQPIVVAAMAVSHYIETQTGWSIKKFVRASRYRTVKLKPATKP